MSPENKLRSINHDEEIERDIRAELSNQGLDGGGFIVIAVDAGAVQITGFAESYAHKWAVERAASRIVGVREMRDYLEVRPPESSQRADGHIAAAARCALAWDARVPLGVGVHVTDGVLRLHGVVERFAQREAAEACVRNLIGVRDVVNEIKTTPVASPADLASEVESALRRRFGMQCRHVWIIEWDGVVTMSGAVATFELLDEVDRVTRGVPGVLRVDNRLLVA